MTPTTQHDDGLFIASEGGEILDLGDGLFMSKDASVVLDAWGFRIVVRPGLSAGRLVAERVEITQVTPGSGVTSEVLRRVSIGALMRTAARDGVRRSRNLPAGQRVDAAWPTKSECEAAKGRDPDADALKLVARIYRLAYLIGDPPTKRVEEMLDLPRSTAGRWVAAARSAGYLTEARGPGRAGG